VSHLLEPSKYGQLVDLLSCPHWLAQLPRFNYIVSGSGSGFMESRTYRRSLSKTEIGRRLIIIQKEFQDSFPPAGVEFILKEGEKVYKVSRDKQNRILRGISLWFREHPTLSIGDTVVIGKHGEDFTIMAESTGGERKGIEGVNLRSVYNLDRLASEALYPKEEMREWEALLKERKQIIFYGPPGTGKTFVAKLFAKYFAGDGGRVELVQFHPSYSYEDFVEGIRSSVVQNTVHYEVKDGILKKFCSQAKEEANRNNRFVLIIDEINRGNVARIFGELIYSLEYRGKNNGVTLPYSGKSFYTPDNLYIVGTMNSADRSIALFDYALRRRFSFVDFMPNKTILEKWFDKNPPLIDKTKILAFWEEVNEAVREEPKLGRHYQVGHSYLMRENLDKDLFQRIKRFDIYPLLEEYFFEEPDKLTALKSSEEAISAEGGETADEASDRAQ